MKKIFFNLKLKNIKIFEKKSQKNRLIINNNSYLYETFFSMSKPKKTLEEDSRDKFLKFLKDFKIISFRNLIHHKLFIIFLWLCIAYLWIADTIDYYCYFNHGILSSCVFARHEQEEIKRLLLGLVCLWIGFKMIKSKINTKLYIYAINLFILLNPFLLIVIKEISFWEYNGFFNFSFEYLFALFIIYLVHADYLIIILSILSLKKINQEKNTLMHYIKDMKSYKKELIVFCVIYSLLLHLCGVFTAQLL